MKGKKASKSVSTVQKKHEPTQKTRENVKILIVAGLPKKLICSIMNISEAMLDKYYRNDIETAMGAMIGFAAQKLAENVAKGDTKAIMFMLSKRGKEFGWGNETNKDAVQEATPVISMPTPVTSENWAKLVVSLKQEKTADENKG